MDQIASKKISQIKYLLNDEIYVSKTKGKNHGAIIALLFELFELINNNVEWHIIIVNEICKIFEEFHELSVEHLFNLFQVNVASLKNIKVNAFQEPSWKSVKVDEKSMINLKDEFVKIKNGLINDGQSLDRIANNLRLPLELLNESHLYFIFYSIFDCSNKMDCIKNNITKITQDLCIFRNTVLSSEIEEMYLTISDVMLSLEQAQQFQSSHNLALDSLHASYKDNCKQLGHYLMAGHYTRSHNTLKSLFYINLCINTIRITKVVSNSLLLCLYWESLIFCRNNNYSAFGKQIFLDVPIENQSFWIRTRFYSSYFNMLANIYEKELPELIYDYVDQNKADLIKESQGVILPWYVLLLRIKSEIREFTIRDPAKLEKHIIFFQELLPKPVAEKYNNTFFGSLQDMKDKLGTAFLELSFTDDRLDFISENKYAISLANILIRKSREEVDMNGYWLAMVIKSDLSVVFSKKEQFLKAHAPGTPFLQKQFDLIKSLTAVNILWLGSDGINIYPLRLSGNEFIWNENNLWTLDATVSFYETVVKKLSFDYRLYNSSAYYAGQNKALRTALNFSLFPPFFNNQIFIIKDFLISSFPHNLIVDPNGFLIIRYPVTNIISHVYTD